MPATDRLHAEQVFHDGQAKLRAAWFAEHPDALRFADDAYLDHETWIRPALAVLGDVRGLPVLDFGCGHGMAAVALARRGADVTAFDLSHGYVDEARRRARANAVDIAFVQANGERLPFADGAFARVWGNAILHHLDLGRAGPELQRVLRPGGIAVFCEPWGENPLLSWARSALPYPHKGQTRDEEPLRWRHIHQLQSVFPHLRLRGFQLLSMLRRLVRQRHFTRGLETLDRRLLTWFPGLNRFCRYVVLTLRRA
jgi:SAM-dependent methyltransferase